MTRHYKKLLLALSVLMLPAAATAQRIDSPYEFQEENQSVSVFAGYLATNPGSQDLGPQSGSYAGARYTIRVSGPALAEGMVSYIPTTRMVYDTVLVAGERRNLGEADLNLLMATIGVRFSLTGPRTWHGLMPNAFFGAGAVIDISPRSELNDVLAGDLRYKFGTAFAGTLGAGVDYFPVSKVSVRLDARANFWQVKPPEGFLLRDSDGVDQEWTQNIGFEAGLAYHF